MDNYQWQGSCIYLVVNSIGQRSQGIFSGQFGKVRENFFDLHANSGITQDGCDPDAYVQNARLSAMLARFDGDVGCKIHHAIYS